VTPAEAHQQRQGAAKALAAIMVVLIVVDFFRPHPVRPW